MGEMIEQVFGDEYWAEYEENLKKMAAPPGIDRIGVLYQSPNDGGGFPLPAYLHETYGYDEFGAPLENRDEAA